MSNSIQLSRLTPAAGKSIFEFVGDAATLKPVCKGWAKLQEELLTPCIVRVWNQIQAQARDDLPEQVSGPSEMRRALLNKKNSWRFEMVTKLDLSSQKLSSIPRELLSLGCVTTLDLSWNHLTDLPMSFYEAFPRLKELNLTKNPLDPSKYLKTATRLADINSLSVLKFDEPTFNIILQHVVQEKSALLRLWDALCHEVPNLPELGTMGEIRDAFKSPAYRQELLSVDSLSLEGCELSVLPPEIFLLENLAALNLAFNPFTTLPHAIRQLKKLETLDLTGTHIPRGVYKPVCEMLRECSALRVVRHHDQDFKFRQKRDLNMRPLPLLPPEAQPEEAPLAPRAAWQEPPAQHKSRCAIL